MKRRASLAATDPSLFANDSAQRNDELDQHDTPLWAAHLIVEQRFGDLPSGALVLEPACGQGVFLRALPAHVDALGIEIDPERAAIARELSGRRVITGDIRTTPLPTRIDAVIGNPPWDLAILDSILDRVRGLMPEGSKAGFFLPAYAFQTEGRVLRYNRAWSIETQSVPRRLWEGLKHPAIYAEFTADRLERLIGFLLYPELAAIRAMPERFRDELTRPAGGMWFAVIRQALEERGGTLSLQGLYEAVEGRRPTANPAWRQQIRKVAYEKLRRVGADRFGLPIAA